MLAEFFFGIDFLTWTWKAPMELYSVKFIRRVQGAKKSTVPLANFIIHIWIHRHQFSLMVTGSSAQFLLDPLSLSARSIRKFRRRWGATLAHRLSPLNLPSKLEQASQAHLWVLLISEEVCKIRQVSWIITTTFLEEITFLRLHFVQLCFAHPNKQILLRSASFFPLFEIKFKYRTFHSRYFLHVPAPQYRQQQYPYSLQVSILRKGISLSNECYRQFSRFVYHYFSQLLYFILRLRKISLRKIRLRFCRPFYCATI